MLLGVRECHCCTRHVAQYLMGCRAHDIATCPRFRAGVDDVLARF